MRALFWLVAVWIVGVGVSAAQPTAAVTMRVQAGFDGGFRAEEWTPLLVEINNDGAPLSGRLIVRPETNGRALANAFSTPIDLPTGTRKEALLYVRLRDFARQVVVEFVGEDDQRYAQAAGPVRPIQPRDKVYVVLTQATVGTLALGDVRPAGSSIVQVTWSPSRLPPHAEALYAADVIFLYDLNPDALTGEQRAALRLWALNGGHLVALGGTRFEGSLAALGEIAPVSEVRARIVDEVDALAAWIGSRETLRGRVEISTGRPVAGAQALIAHAEGPLLVRRSVGDGTVDFFGADPLLAPLAVWDELPRFWQQMLTGVPLANSWGRGLMEPSAAATAIATLPGEELLTPVSALVAFVVAYLIVIGPLNYWLLTRLKRQEWAWGTIPLSIALFTLVASTVGFNLRGNEVLLSRLRVVRLWDGQPQALEQTLIGLLSPRRDTFTVAPAGERFLYALPSVGQAAANLQSTAEVVQSITTSARNMTVDGGIYSNFALTQPIAAPAISGALTLRTNPDGSQTYQGFIRNDTASALQSPVILSRRGALQLPDIAAGEALTIAPGEFTYVGLEGQPVASRFENSRALRPSFSIGRQASAFTELNTASLILPQSSFTPDLTAARAFIRRQSFLHSFIRDQYNHVALGDRLYLIGWSNEFPRDVEIPSATWRSVDDTLYIVGLTVTVEPPAGRVTLAADQFLWTMLERIIPPDRELARTAGLLDVANAGVDDIILNPDEGVVVQFAPLPTAQLAAVDSFTLTFNRASGFANQLEVSLWNWQANTWDLQDVRLQEYTMDDPSAYVGPGNAVRARLVSTFATGVSRLRNLRITMSGRPA
ncbi:hypothetical protein VZO05_00785 [Aggregatilineales bacterium SYSU G02658]